MYSVTTTEYVGDDDGNLRAIRGHEVVSAFVGGRPTFEKVEGSEFEIPADFVFLAMGFLGPEKGGLLEQFGVALDGRGNVARNAAYATSVDGVFVAGDMGRGQSLIVWAIAEGRSAARACDEFLMGSSDLPSPLVAAATR